MTIETCFLASAAQYMTSSHLIIQIYTPESSWICGILSARGVSAQLSHTLSVSARSPRKSGMS